MYFITFFGYNILKVIILKKKWWIFLILIIILIFGLAFYFINKNNSKDENYSASRTSSNENTNQNNIANENFTNSTSQKNAIELTENSTGSPIKTEEEISFFTTKIYSKDTARQNNIAITCSTLNNTIVSNGSTFSFCNTVGQSTSAKGYQEADIFDKNGNKKKGLGRRKLSSKYNSI